MRMKLIVGLVIGLAGTFLMAFVPILGAIVAAIGAIILHQDWLEISESRLSTQRDPEA